MIIKIIEAEFISKSFGREKCIVKNLEISELETEEEVFHCKSFIHGYALGNKRV